MTPYYCVQQWSIRFPGHSSLCLKASTFLGRPQLLLGGAAPGPHLLRALGSSRGWLAWALRRE